MSDDNKGLLVTFDKKRGMSYIYLAGKIEAGAAVRQMQVGPDIVLDFDSAGHLLGVELLSANRLHPTLKAIAVEP